MRVGQVDKEMMGKVGIQAMRLRNQEHSTLGLFLEISCEGVAVLSANRRSGGCEK